MSEGMLDTLTVLDFSSTGPGPRCTRLLADYGMQVIKIRPPSGNSRSLDGPWFSSSANRNIPQLHVDLKHEDGRRLVHRLLTRVDAVIESYRPGVAARLGIGYVEVRATNPSIVYCSVSGYGQGGPYAQWTGHELNFLALAGFLGARADDGTPMLPGGVVADAFGAYSTAVAVLSALLSAQATGRGAYLDVSIVDSVLRAMLLDLDRHLAYHGANDGAGDGDDNEAGAQFDDSSPTEVLTGGAASYGVYAASDGRWLALAAIEEQTWAALCRGLDLEHRIPAQHDHALQHTLRAELASAFGRRTAAEWFGELGSTACLTPVNSPAEVLADPHLTSRPLTLAVRVGARTVRQLSPRLPVPDPPGLAGQPAGPSTDEQADDALRRLGLTEPEIAELRRRR
jgi:alpha-methylacyl-CoA racemase